MRCARLLDKNSLLDQKSSGEVPQPCPFWDAAPILSLLCQRETVQSEDAIASHLYSLGCALFVESDCSAEFRVSIRPGMVTCFTLRRGCVAVKRVRLPRRLFSKSGPDRVK
jgi:hypothetical protein